MDPAQWRKIEAMFEAALGVELSQRAAFLQENCGGDESLRREVESLLLHGENAGRFLHVPAAAHPLEAGQRVSRYEIQEKLGEGGMGAVYRAYDTHLHRPVALKVLRPEYASDPERRERLLREARAAAALSHPSIVGIYEVGSENGVDFIALQFVEGKCLGEIIPAKGLPLEKVLDYAVQIASGLAKAHAAGVIHRDLTPGNIMLTPDGLVKLLDFGLARRVEVGEGHDRTLTVEGEILGTPAYMSPEQARGITNLTVQSDQFSFGLVLYELAAAKRAFVRGSAAETMTAIIREEAKPLPETVPAPLRWMIERLLAKEPAERYDSTRDLYRELKQIREQYSETPSAQQIRASDVAPAPTPARKRPVLTGIGLAATGLAAGLGLAALLIRSPRTDLSAYKFTRVSRGDAMELYPAWSPDGKNIAFTSNVRGLNQVFTKTLGAPDAAQLTHASDNSTNPFWSPDGATVYFTSRGNLWAIGASGGTPELVREKTGTSALSPDGGTLAFNRDGKTWAGPLKGSAPREIWQPPYNAITWQRFSPDGSKLAIIDRDDLWVLPYPSGTARNLGRAVGYAAGWLPDSHHLLVAGAGSSATLAILNITDASRRVIYRATHELLYPSVSPDGRKISYSAGETEWDVLEVSVPDGRVHTMAGGGGLCMLPDWAPSGTHFLFSTGRVAFDSQAVEDRSVADGFSRRIAEAPEGSESESAFSARWAPDGTRFLFVHASSQRFELTVANLAGGRWTPLVYVTGNARHAHAWSPDGQWIVFVRVEGGKQQLVKIRPAAGATPVVLAAPVPEVSRDEVIQWSPSGDWILYSAADGMSMASPDGNTVRKLTARNLRAYGFSKDGAHVYGIFRNTTGVGAEWQLYAIDVKTGAEKMLASVDLPASTQSMAGFSLHPDGKRFLTSIGRWPFHIWMLEGFDQPARNSWLDRLLRL
jgi:serine/threonine protein kinase